MLEESKNNSLPAGGGGGGGGGEGEGGGGGGDSVGDTLSEAELKRLRKEAPPGLILTFTRLHTTCYSTTRIGTPYRYPFIYHVICAHIYTHVCVGWKVYTYAHV